MFEKLEIRLSFGVPETIADNNGIILYFPVLQGYLPQPAQLAERQKLAEYLIDCLRRYGRKDIKPVEPCVERKDTTIKVKLSK